MPTFGAGRVVCVKLLFQFRQVLLMLLIVEMIFSLQVLDEAGYSAKHVFSSDSLAVVLDHLANFLESVMLVHTLDCSASLIYTMC